LRGGPFHFCEDYTAGHHEAALAVGALPSGLYVLRVRTEAGHAATTRFTVAR
jgi:hypothetical protein